MKNSLFLGLFALSFSLWSSVAIADGVLAAPGAGGGQYGANRRVRTDESGYTAVKGSFKLPTYKIPNFLATSVASNTNNPYESRPSFYLGASRGDEFQVTNGFEIDAGFAYENYAPPRKVVGPVPPGWSVFVRTKSNGNNTYVNAGGAWRCGPGTPNASVTDVDLMWTFYKQSVTSGGGYGGYLTATVRDLFGNPLPLDSQPKDGGTDGRNSGVRIRARSGVDYTIGNAINAARVKRVIAITQSDRLNYLQFPIATGGGVYQEDGSYMRGLSFTQGQVSQQDPAPGGFNLNYTPSQWLDWDSTNTDNGDNQSGSTGYYPGGNDKTVLGYQLVPPFAGVPIPTDTGRKAAGSLPVFSFPGIPQPQWIDVISSRYSSEKVDINLRSFVPVGGSRISLSGITPDVE